MNLNRLYTCNFEMYLQKPTCLTLSEISNLIKRINTRLPINLMRRLKKRCSSFCISISFVPPTITLSYLQIRNIHFQLPDKNCFSLQIEENQLAFESIRINDGEVSKRISFWTCITGERCIYLIHW